MDDEAIREDAPVADQNVDPAPEQTAAPEEFQESPQGPINKREADMARLREKRKEEREAGRKAAALMNDPDLTEERLSDAEEQSTDDLGSTQDAVPAGWDRRDDGVLVKRLKVNGEIRELTQEEYDRQLSKELAGDQKLRLAAEREQQLRQWEAELNDRQRQAQEQPPAKPAAAPDLDEAFDGFVSAFYEGDADAARERFKAIIEGRQTSDVVLKEVQTEHPDWDVGDLYMETGKRTRAKLALDKLKRPAPRADAERMERKANLKPVPRAGNAAAVQPAKPQIDMSPTAKIERMRQARAR